MKIAICTNFVSPYRRPVFRALAEQTGAEVRVFVSTEMEADRQWAIQSDANEPFTIECVRGIRQTWTKRTRGAVQFDQALERHYPIGLPLALAAYRPDVVVSGELGPRTAAAMAYCAMAGVPIIPWAYPPRAQAGRSAGTSFIQRTILKNSACIIGMGTQARSVLKELGAEDHKIFDAPNAADAGTIAERLRSSKHRTGVQRIKAHHAGARIAVAVGRLVPMKGIKELVEAWNSIESQLRSEWNLVFVGDGPMRSYIEHHRKDGSISVRGHVDPDEIPDWYAAADLHIFASLGDPWGLVVNEAMQCGTPTLCSSLAGCCDDLVRDGINNLVWTPTQDLDARITDLSDAVRRPDLSKLGLAARVDVQTYAPQHMATRMQEAIAFAVSGNSTHTRKALG